MTRLVVTLALFCLITSPAHAMPCWAIKQAVAIYGESAALQWARTHGYSERQIEQAKRCLK